MNNLADAINTMSVNHLNLTPTVSADLSPDEVPIVKVLINVGEALTQVVVDQWANQVALFNAYGPAECSIFAAIKGHIQAHDDPSNIGMGVGAKTWITNPTNPDHMVPIGGIGEIVIEGHILARGYLGDEEKTRRSFILDPAWSRHSHSDISKCRRFYRTGDLSKFNVDGHIAFIGRNDEQVKLRGQRVEVGEIENQIRRTWPSTTRLAVSIVSPRDAPQAKGITAFIELRDQGANIPMSPQASDNGGLVEKSLTELEEFKAIVCELTAACNRFCPPS